MEFYRQKHFDYGKYKGEKKVEESRIFAVRKEFVIVALFVLAFFISWADYQYRLSDKVVIAYETIVHNYAVAQPIVQVIEKPNLVKDEVAEVVRKGVSSEPTEWISLNKLAFSMEYPGNYYPVRDFRNDTEIITLYDQLGLKERAESDTTVADGLTILTMVKPDGYSTLDEYAKATSLGEWEHTAHYEQWEFAGKGIVPLTRYRANTGSGMYDLVFYTEEGYPYILSFMYPAEGVLVKNSEDYKKIISSVRLNNYNLPSNYREALNQIINESSSNVQ